MADAEVVHQVWWSGQDKTWSCTCGSEYLVTDIDAERHYLTTHNQPVSHLDPERS